MIVEVDGTRIAAELRQAWRDLQRRLGQHVEVILPLLDEFRRLEEATDAACEAGSCGLDGDELDAWMESYYDAAGWAACDAVADRLRQALG